MANAKEYKDLTEAASIDTDALVALAQPNAPELQTSKMSALAAKVQELNTDGPLAELELATSIGKQQLAEALTEKGATSTSSDTLVQMADKLRNLQVDDTTENIVAYYQVSKYKKDPANVNSSRVFKHVLTGDMIVTYGTTIYYVPYSDGFTSFADIIAAATHTFDVSTLNSNYTLDLTIVGSFCVSEDFTKLLVSVNSDNSTHLVFNVSSEQGFTLLHTVAKTFNTQYPVCAIDDTGNIIAYIPSTVVKRGFTMYNASNDTDYPYVFANDSASYFVDMFIKNNKLYAYRSDINSSSQDNLSSVEYVISEDGAISFSNAIKSKTLSRSGYSGYVNGNFWLHQPGMAGDPIYVSVNGAGYKSVPGTGVGYYRAYRSIDFPQLWFTKNLYGSSPVTIKGFRFLAGNENDINVFLAAIKAAIITYEDNVYTLKMPGMVDLTIDTSSSSYELATQDGTLVSFIYDSYSSGQNPINGIYSSLTSGIILISNYQQRPNMLSTLYKYVMSTDAMGKKILAKRRTVNGITVYYDPILQRSEIDSTAYDINVQSVPLPESETQEGN